MADVEKKDQYEISRPALDASDVKAAEVKAGQIYMVKPGENLRFPIHPAPGADNKISKLLRQSEVIVISNEKDVTGRYLRTVLPIPGWVRKACIDEGMLMKVEKDTFSDLVDVEEDGVLSGCDKCLRNCGCLRGCYTSVRKHPIYLFLIYNVLNFLAVSVQMFDWITDVLVAAALANAGENWLYVLYFYILPHILIFWHFPLCFVLDFHYIPLNQNM